VEWSRRRRFPLARFSIVKGGEARVETRGRSRVIAREMTEARARATAFHLQNLIDTIKLGTWSTENALHARNLVRIVAAGYNSARRAETIWLGDASNERF